MDGGSSGSGVSFNAQLASFVFPPGLSARKFKSMYNEYLLQMQQLSIRPVDAASLT